MDTVDVATELAERHRLYHLARSRGQSAGPGARLVSGERLCEDCGEPIPQRRLRAVPGARRCRECQELAETLAGRGGAP